MGLDIGVTEGGGVAVAVGVDVGVTLIVGEGVSVIVDVGSDDIGSCGIVTNGSDVLISA
ncbi:MAG: hypothetical protein WBB08_13695 [Halobacteriota archaeon]